MFNDSLKSASSTPQEHLQLYSLDLNQAILTIRFTKYFREGHLSSWKNKNQSQQSNKKLSS